ncbi:MAG: SPFH domain-containing protein [Brevundimonas sp.]|uniref:SPFH domain-containing protein n=1 Tax=Brevundimonas sp. TaxID=1871086 RepID=UPI00391C7610
MFDPWGLLAVAVVVVIAFGVALLLSGRRRIRINAWQRGALYVDGVYERLLDPGVHWLWKTCRNLHVQPVTLDRQVHVIRADVMSSERMALRLSAAVIYRIEDAERSIREPVEPLLDLAAGVALTRLAGEMTLEALLAQSPDADAAFAALMGDTVGAARIEQAQITGVILPPELRRLMTEVERARLEGLAALERARGEQASLRSLANAARLLKDNPELAQLRLLKTVENAKAATVVLGDDRRR